MCVATRFRYSLLLTASLLVACGSDTETPEAADASVPGGPDADTSVLPGPLPPLVEDRSVYDSDDLTIREIRITHTDSVGYNDVVDEVEGAEIRVLMKEGDFALSETLPNGTMRLRGATARYAPQKSFRIKLDAEAGLWREQRVIMLNKHSYEQARVRNKLSFDLFKDIPNFTSLRTSFVHLYINDEDMGLYTQIERPGKAFLQAHGLDPLGQLYKARDFDFSAIPPEIVADPIAMEEVIDAKANANHAKLLELIADVEDESLTINELLEKRFNRDNYLTWLAISVVTMNFDTTVQNFFLYSPSRRSGWYFLPWDYDDALGASEQPGETLRARYEAGLSNWAIIDLHRRFFAEPQNVVDLTARIEEIAASYINDQSVAVLLASYSDIVRSYTTVPPDLYELPISSDSDEEAIASFDAEYTRLGSQASVALAEFYAVLPRPMPVYMGPPEVIADGHLFSWDESFDLQGDAVTYDLQVSSDPEFAQQDIVIERLGLIDPEVEISPALDAGSYYAQVIIRDDDDPAANFQLCAEQYYDELIDFEYKGVLAFDIP